MLSRVVVSQVKHNSYFLAGLALGLVAALVAVPLDEAVQCAAGPPGALGAGAAALGAVGGDEPLEAARAVRPAGGGGGARSVQRPRYYTTELGMRAPLLAAILTTEEALAEGGMGAALNSSLAALGGALRFFISASAPAAAGRANVVAFTDSREMLKPFHALKYLADNHLDEYDFFFVAADTAYVNARSLLRLARSLSVSRDAYMGSVAADDSHYCALDGGVLLSNSVLRAVHAELDWCVRNSYSAHHHENIGRCVLHAAHQDCAPRLQRQTYRALRDPGDEAAPPAGLGAAAAVTGVSSPRRLRRLHALACRHRLQRAAARRRVLTAAVRRALLRAPPHYRNVSWPRGLREDPGLAPPKPDNRWDHLRWTSFNATHVLMPDEHVAAAALGGVQARALRLVLAAAAGWARRAWGARVELVEGAWAWEPARALRYRLVVRAEGAGGAALRQLEVARPLGAARLVPVPYVTESARVWLVLPAAGADAGPALAFLRRYEAACLQRRANTALVVVAGGAGVDELRAALAELRRRHPAAELLLAEAPGPQSSRRWALDAALRLVPRDGLLLLAAPHADFNEDFLNRVRMNCIPGAQWFLPVGFARYSLFDHPRFLVDGARPQTGTGRFNARHHHVLAVYRTDYEAARAAWLAAGQDGAASAAEVLGAAAVRCVHAPEPGLVLAAAGAPCGLGPGGGGGGLNRSAACLRAHRDRGFEDLDLGARHSLARLLLETEAERA